MQKKPLAVRQGDVLVEHVAEPTSKRAKKGLAKKKVILAHGEVTGHAHVAHGVLEAETEQDGSLIFHKEQALGSPIEVSELEIKEAMADLAHDEHATLALQPGKHRVIRQREYHPEEIRNVAD